MSQSPQSGLVIDFDMTQVPDQVSPIGPGVYTVGINGINIENPKPKPDGTVTAGKNVILDLVIMDQGPEKGRQKSDWIFISADPKMTPEQRARNLTSLKRVAMSCGITPGNGFDVRSLMGRQGRIRIESSSYQDKSGRRREGSEIAEWLIPTDPGYVSGGAPQGLPSSQPQPGPQGPAPLPPQMPVAPAVNPFAPPVAAAPVG